MSRNFQTKVSMAAAMVAAFTMSGCTKPYGLENESPLIFKVALVNDGAKLNSDVITDGAVRSDEARVLIGVRFKNPNLTTAPNIPSAVQVERYEIKYVRSDGRGVEGQDVPYSISGVVTSIYDVKFSGVDPLILTVVRAQAKLEPPLRNLRGSVSGNFGGALVVTMFAEITIYGRTVSGIPVKDTGYLQIDFADFPDEN